MQRNIVILTAAAVLLLSGCRDESPHSQATMASPPSAAMQVEHAGRIAPAALNRLGETAGRKRASEWLAYRHDVSVESSNVSAAYARTREACFSLDGCRLISASLTAGDHPYAHLGMRMPAAAIETVKEVASSSNTITSSTTSATDYREEVTDITARQSMLHAQRTSLIDIQSRANKVSDLIEVAQELSRVQNEIEALDGRFNRIKVETSSDFLTISFATPVTGGRWFAPVIYSFQSVPSEFASSLGAVIAFIAFAVPWLIPFSLFVFIWRIMGFKRPTFRSLKFWRRKEQ
ncbi:DUF4349 domain-containing protein [Thalassospira xianhensis]|uniref:DUF4349 domain-containing protein n=1 Tax=Thalassospira xianhensis MCCC 1A02616 TaxID=1177929 RepID=A0A367UGX3_9PROT|nr:DUF4349 domain-containing protein [Thalassospira xianhensis]RCK06302.1 hypothetical protein TH5_08855 [Thalassospira xianhensis MCCC 1A02616]